MTKNKLIDMLTSLRYGTERLNAGTSATPKGKIELRNRKKMAPLRQPEMATA
jgi:hypothetical protein